MIKEHPIPFTVEMIQAILAGRKTMTRRVIKPQPKIYPDRIVWKTNKYSTFTTDLKDKGWPIKCPYGQVGDLLWVKKGRFMPKKEATIWLEITNIRVERLQDISQMDIENEGIDFVDGYLNELCKWRDCVSGIHNTRIKYFKQLWDKFNSKRGCGWNTNPWVWVIEFKRIKN